MRHALLVLLGCGRIGFDAQPPESHSGSRLKLIWHELDGQRFVDRSTYYDSQLDIECSPLPLLDGTTRCAPPALSGLRTFADSGCTQPVLVTAAPSCGREHAVVQEVAGSCGALRYRVHPIGSELPATSYFLLDAQAQCLGPYTTQEPVFELLDEVLPSELVELVTRHETGAGRLVRRYYESDDGFRAPRPLTYYDQDLAAGCSAKWPTYSEQGIGITSCFPTNTLVSSASGLFADAACTQELTADFSQCQAVRFAAPYNACGDYSVHEAVEVNPSQVYGDIAAQCTALNPDPTAKYFLYGAPIPRATLELAPGAGTSRLVPLYEMIGDGAREPYGIYDRSIGAVCEPDRDGRCKPSGVGLGTYFTDSACTQPIELITHVYLTQCAATKPAIAARYTDCSVELFRLGAPYTGTVYTTTPACVVLPQQLSLTYNFYERGEPVTDFATLKRVVDR